MSKWTYSCIHNVPIKKHLRTHLQQPNTNHSLTTISFTRKTEHQLATDTNPIKRNAGNTTDQQRQNCEHRGSSKTDQHQKHDRWQHHHIQRSNRSWMTIPMTTNDNNKPMLIYHTDQTKARTDMNDDNTNTTATDMEATEQLHTERPTTND
jgi:hypothetical protein